MAQGIVLDRDPDRPVVPVDRHHPVAGDQDLAARQPDAGVDRDVRQDPAAGIGNEIADAAEGAVGGGDVVSDHFARAAQIGMGVVLFRPVEGVGRDRRLGQGGRHRAEPGGREPVGHQLVMTVQLGFLAARDGLFGIDVGTALDLLHGQIDAEAAGGRVRPAERRRAEQHLVPVQERAGPGDKIAHRPTVVLEQEIIDRTDLAVDRPDAIADQFDEAAQHGRSPSGAPIEGSTGQHRAAAAAAAFIHVSGRVEPARRRAG